MLSNSELPLYSRRFGIVDRAVIPGRLWRVKFQGTYWFARLYDPNQPINIRPGDAVKVMAMEGITLLVLPALCRWQTELD